MTTGSDGLCNEIYQDAMIEAAQRLWHIFSLVLVLLLDLYPHNTTLPWYHLQHYTLVMLLSGRTCAFIILLATSSLTLNSFATPMVKKEPDHYVRESSMHICVMLS